MKCQGRPFWESDCWAEFCRLIKGSPAEDWREWGGRRAFQAKGAAGSCVLRYTVGRQGAWLMRGKQRNQWDGDWPYFVGQAKDCRLLHNSNRIEAIEDFKDGRERVSLQPHCDVGKLPPNVKFPCQNSWATLLMWSEIYYSHRWGVREVKGWRIAPWDHVQSREREAESKVWTSILWRRIPSSGTCLAIIRKR